VACAPDSVDEVLGIFRVHGFAQAAVVGSVEAAQGAPRLVIG
jgi:selenide,water dikinase